MADTAQAQCVPGSIADEADLLARKISGTPNGQQVTKRFPVEVPGVRLADDAAALHTDLGHSRPSLSLPQAAVGLFPLWKPLVKLFVKR